MFSYELQSILCFQEKYGPKGQGKSLNEVNAKPKNDSKPKPDFDVNVGLSERSPWFCRYVQIICFPSWAYSDMSNKNKSRAKKD